MNECPKGKIMRSSYKRKSYKRSNSKKIIPSTQVSAKCITDQGKPGKGEKLFTITNPSLLRKYGYTTKESREKRETSLKKAMNRENPLEVLRHLNAVRTVNKSKEDVFNKMNSDMKYVQREYKKISKKISKKSAKKIKKI